MPKVPLFDQNQLASSMVGTSGVGGSTAALFGSIADSAESVGNTAYAIQAAEYQRNQTELRQRQAEVRAAEKELRNIQRSAETNGMASGYSVKLNTLANERQKADGFNTDNTLTEFTTQAKQWMDEDLETITDPTKKAMAQKAYTDVMTSQTNSLSDWAKSRTLPIIEGSIKGMAGDLSAKLKDSTVGDWDTTGKMLEEYDRNIGLYTTMYGKEGLTRLRADQDAALKQRVASIANGDNPEQLETLDKNPVVKTYMEPTTFHGFLKDQRIVAAQRKAEIKDETQRQQKADNMEANTSWIGLTTNGDPRTISPYDFQQFKGSAAWQALSQDERKMLERGQAGADEYAKEQALKIQKTNQKKQAPIDDGRVMFQLGQQARHVNNLYDKLNSTYGAMIQKGHKRTDGERAELAGQLDSFQEAHMNILQMQKSLQTPEARQKAATDLSQIEYNVDNIKKILRAKGGGEVKAAYAENQRRAEIKNMVGYENPYASPQKASMYNFYYNSRYNEEFQKLERAGRLDDIRSNKRIKGLDGKMIGARDALKWYLRKYAAENVERAWGNRGR